MSESIKEKLYKLIKFQESAQKIGNLKEAENAAARITELLMKYNLELEDAKGPEDRFSSRVEGFLWNLEEKLMQRHEGQWIINLTGMVAYANMCKIIIKNKNKTLVDLIGTDVNRDITQYMVEQLITNLRHIGKKEFRAYTGPTKRNTWLRGFYIGAVQSLTTRLMLERKEREGDTKTNALMITRGREVQKYIDEKYGRLGTANTSSRSKGLDGMSRGREVGKSIGLNKGVSGSGSRTKYLGS